MEPERAELSTVSTTLDDVMARVAELAEALQASGHDALAVDLFEVERSLHVARRRLAQVARRMG